METDASDNTIIGLLNEGHPFTFYSRTLHQSELKQLSIEKEACAIIEVFHYWRHLLTSKHFKFVTDQQLVSFMLNKQSKSKIKNDKINCWRMEHSYYSFDIVYRKGLDNIALDTL